MPEGTREVEGRPSCRQRIHAPQRIASPLRRHTSHYSLAHSILPSHSPSHTHSCPHYPIYAHSLSGEISPAPQSQAGPQPGGIRDLEI
jgi:hypothetical protein